MIRGIVIVIIYLASLVGILFISAVRINRPMGWASLGIYILISIINLTLADPTLVTERAQMRTGVNMQDMVLASLSFLFFFPLTLLVAGLDIGRCGWSPPIPLAVQVIALSAFAFGNAIGSWAMVRNKYISTFLCIQKDRNHKVITDGPYRRVRYPGYAGVILASIARSRWVPFGHSSLRSWGHAVLCFAMSSRTGPLWKSSAAIVSMLNAYDSACFPVSGKVMRVTRKPIPGDWGDVFS